MLLIKGGMAFLCSSTPAHRKPAPPKSAVYPQGADMPAAKPAAPPLHSTTARRHEPAHSRKEGKAASNVVARCQEARYQEKALCSWYFAANKLPTRIAVRLCAANHRSLLCKRGAQKKKKGALPLLLRIQITLGDNQVLESLRPWKTFPS